MDKINFKNLPDRTTPITAEQLNNLQNNVANAIKATLIASETLITVESGFEILETSLYKQENHYFGYVIIHNTNGNFSSNQVHFGKLNVNIASNVNFFGVMSSSQWAQPSGLAYVFINTQKNMFCRGTNTPFLKFYLDIVSTD